MHIRAIVLGCVAALGMLAMAPVAMADPAPDICVLDLSQPVSLDQAIKTGTSACAIIAVAEVEAVPIAGGDEDEAAFTQCDSILRFTAVSLYRLHVDPGRCLV